MHRSFVFLRIPLIILALTVAIITPIILQGYIYLGQAQAAFDRKDYSTAADNFESAARRLLWKPELWEKAGISFEYAGNLEDALRLFKSARQNGKLSANGWDFYGRGYWDDGKPREALEIWTAGHREYPAHLEFYSQFALAYRDLKDFDAERNALEIWLAAGKGTALEHYELGQLLMYSDPQRSLQQLLQASALDPEFNDIVQTLHTSLNLATPDLDPARRLVIIGRGLGLVNEWELAAKSFEQALASDGTNAEAWAWLGEARQHLGQDGKAELDKAIIYAPDEPIIYALRGLYWNRQGNYSKALLEYQRSAQIEPINPNWQISIGEAYTLNGDLVSGLIAYQNAVSLAPQDGEYWRLLASFCADNNIQVLELGLPAAQKAAELEPTDPRVLDTLGISYLKAGYLYNAEQNLLKAIKFLPGFSLAHIHLAETYLQKGDQASAFNELSMARQLDPNGSDGQFAGRLLNQYFP